MSILTSLTQVKKHKQLLENQQAETWDLCSVRWSSANDGLPFIFQPLLLPSEAVSAETIVWGEKGGGGALADMPTAGCQKELHSWAMMSDAVA